MKIMKRFATNYSKCIKRGNTFQRKTYTLRQNLPYVA